jgi:AraC-like DNA-binding protein
MQKNFRQLRYLLLPAPEAVADLVDGLWQMDNPTATPQSFTVLPDGCFKLLLTRRPDSPPVLTLSGIWTHAFEITLAAHTTIVGIRCKLLAAEHLLTQPLPLNAAVPLPLAGWCYDTLAAPTLAEVAQRLTAHLAPQRPDPRRRALFERLYAGAGSWPVARLAAASGWPARQINRYFQARFGLSLKTYSNVLRSYAAAQQLQPDDLFAAGNYYDQSHGIRELKKYTGASPRQLHQQRHDRFIQLSPPQPDELCPP